MQGYSSSFTTSVEKNSFPYNKLPLDHLNVARFYMFEAKRCLQDFKKHHVLNSSENILLSLMNILGNFSFSPNNHRRERMSK